MASEAHTREVQCMRKGQFSFYLQLNHLKYGALIQSLFFEGTFDLINDLCHLCLSVHKCVVVCLCEDEFAQNKRSALEGQDMHYANRSEQLNPCLCENRETSRVRSTQSHDNPSRHFFSPLLSKKNPRLFILYLVINAWCEACGLSCRGPGLCALAPSLQPGATLRSGHSPPSPAALSGRAHRLIAHGNTANNQRAKH